MHDFFHTHTHTQNLKLRKFSPFRLFWVGVVHIGWIKGSGGVALMETFQKMSKNFDILKNFSRVDVCKHHTFQMFASAGGSTIGNDVLLPLLPQLALPFLPACGPLSPFVRPSLRLSLPPRLTCFITYLPTSSLHTFPHTILHTFWGACPGLGRVRPPQSRRENTPLSQPGTPSVSLV